MLRLHLLKLLTMVKTPYFSNVPNLTNLSLPLDFAGFQQGAQLHGILWP